MTTIESVAGGVIIDGKRMRADTVTGKILKVRGKYFLQLRGRKMEIPMNPLAPETEIAALAGKEVNVALSAQAKPSVIAIGTWPTPEEPEVGRFRRIICYIPAPEILGDLNSRVQEIVLKGMSGK